MSNEKWKMSPTAISKWLSLPTGDIAGAEFRRRRRGRIGKRDILHTQIGEQTLKHLRFLRIEIAASLGFQHSQDIDPVFGGFQIDASFLRKRMRHNSQGSGRVG